MSEAKNLKSEKNRIDLALEFLRAKHPLKTAQCVAADTGISFKTVHSWLLGNSKPGWHHTLQLIGTYGPEFLAAVCPSSRVWVEPARKLEELRQLESQRVQLNQRIKALGGNQNANAGVGTISEATGGVSSGRPGQVASSSIGLDGNERLADGAGNGDGGP